MSRGELEHILFFIEVLFPLFEIVLAGSILCTLCPAQRGWSVLLTLFVTKESPAFVDVGERLTLTLHYGLACSLATLRRLILLMRRLAFAISCPVLSGLVFPV